MWIYRRGFLEHDRYRHTLVTELAESGAGDEVIMSFAGHVSRAMLSRYSNVRMEAKRKRRQRDRCRAVLRRTRSARTTLNGSRKRLRRLLSGNQRWFINSGVG
jgi:hypothetical protein